MAVNEERNPESVDDESNRTTNEPTPGPSNASQTSRRRKNPLELIEAGKTMNKALNTLSVVLNQRSVVLLPSRKMSVSYMAECWRRN